jgi:hypothetical protein
VSYKQIHETFWTDPQVKKYKPMQRYLFSYFITGPHAHYSGLYYLPMIYIQNETGMSIKEITDGIVFLTQKDHVFYDLEREVIFVKSEMLYQLDNKRDGRVVLNEKHITGLKRHFDTLHKSPLIAKFLETYSYLNIEYTGIDRGINTPMDRDSVPFPVTVTKELKDTRTTIPPKIEDVIAYCKERNNGIDPQYWWDSYQAKGWMIGNNRMKDWQSAIRTWEKNNKNNPLFQQQQPIKFGLSPESEAQIKQRDEYEAKLRRQRESEDE